MHGLSVVSYAKIKASKNLAGLDFFLTNELFVLAKSHFFFYRTFGVLLCFGIHCICTYTY